jgi:NADH-quinone oxidoreductase subunit L
VEEAAGHLCRHDRRRSGHRRFFPFAGFFSKDAILYAAFAGPNGKALWFVGLVTALLTSFYMFRLWYLAFWASRAARGSSA